MTKKHKNQKQNKKQFENEFIKKGCEIKDEENKKNELIVNEISKEENEHIKNNKNKEIKKSESDDEMEMDIEEIILNMRIISEIKENYKLVANNDCLEIDTRYIQSIQRWWYEDGRQTAIIKISKIVNDLFNFIDKTYSENGKNKNNDVFGEDRTHLFQRIHRILLNSVKGLENLKMTYKNDIKTITKIDIIIEKINIKVEIMGSKIKFVV